MLLRLLPILLVLCLKSCLCEDNLLITTDNGKIQGAYGTSANGRQFRRFQRIPYAKPPTGSLRFQFPQPAEPWTDTLDGTLPASVCPQYDFIDMKTYLGDEDCLHLNVYTPILNNSDTKLPVMVFIHGGAFYVGTSGLYPPEYLLDKNIVLVTLNYRLDALGFLATGDDVVYGNNAYRDQILALKWVQHNIEKFGGNKDEVTIFGESAGGCSTHWLSISPLSKGLFKRVISQSGFATSFWGSRPTEKIVSDSKRLAEFLGCSNKNNHEMIECLRGVPVKDIVFAHLKFMTDRFDPIVVFGPSIEPSHPNAFIDALPEEYYKNNKVTPLPWMIGVVTHEGTIRTGEIYHKSNENFTAYEEKYITHARDLFVKYDDPDFESKAIKIKDFYFGEKGFYGQKDKFTDMLTDGWFAYPGDVAATLHQTYQKSAPLYYYNFDYRGTCSFAAMYDPENTKDVCHGDDLLYLFPMCKRVQTEEDLLLRDKIVDLWTNFAIYGDPTPDKVWTAAKWEPVSTSAKEYLHISNPNKIEMSSNLFKSRFVFWRSLYPTK